MSDFVEVIDFQNKQTNKHTFVNPNYITHFISEIMTDSNIKIEVFMINGEKIVYTSSVPEDQLLAELRIIRPNPQE